MLRVAARDVNADALEDDENPGGEDGNPDDADDPVDFGCRRPAEEEEADGWEEYGEECGFEAELLRRRGGERA